MAWIESHQALAQHPKVLQLAKACGWSNDETIGKLHKFWWWCLDYATDGRLDKFDHSTIASVFGVHEHGENVVHVLLKLNWLDSEPSIRVHDWWDYAGRFLQVRYKRTPKIWKEIKRFYGHSIQHTNNRTGRDKQPTNNNKPNQPNLTNLNQPNLTKPSISSATASPCVGGTDGQRVWERYKSAYLDRYKTEPVRNATTNSQLAQLVKRLGGEAACNVAEFYVWHNDQFYVRARHPPGLLLRDAEGLHTQWATGVRATADEAKNLEQRDNRIGQFERVMAKLEGK